MFCKKLSDLPSCSLNFHPYPSAADRCAWDKLSAQTDIESALMSDGRKRLAYNFPSLPPSLYLSFTRRGNRTDYENLYFEKRIALGQLVLAECIQYEGRFLDKIIDGIFSICEETGWQLPAHNSKYRDCPQDPLPAEDYPILDLFACETGALLAVTCYLLGDVLDQVTPIIGKNIRYELNRRILIPYTTCHFWWMGDGTSLLNNWTTWCTQNVLLTALLISDDQELKRKIIGQACHSLDDFLKDYGEDGCCSEGAQYYRHAGLCLFQCMDILNQVTGDHFRSLYEENKIRNIALYIYHVHIEGEYYVNFADCAPKAGWAGVREYLFGWHIQSRDLMEFAADHFSLNPERLDQNQQNLYYRLQLLFTLDEISGCPTDYSRAGDIYYESNGLLCARDNTLFLAAKAGNNDDSHNHNDVGSFTIYKDGLPLLIDIGVETYTKKTFSDHRYEIWTMQSSFHNLPDIGSYSQLPGPEYAASDVQWELTPDSASLSCDLVHAYPADCGLEYYKRSLLLHKNDSILLSDTFAFKATPLPVILNLISYDRPAVNGSTIQIGTGTLTILTPFELELETYPITDARLQSTWKHEIYRMRIRPLQNQIKIRIQ